MKRSWLEQNPYWKIPLGCLILIVLIGLFAVTLITVITTSIRCSDAYKQAMTQSAANSQVRELIGEPIKPAWFISGQLNVSGSTGNANLSIPISGPRGKGTIRAVANKAGGVWRFTELQVIVEGQPGAVDLLSIQPPTERDF
jgi:Cytochrome oxidase complex assembly protein 1